MPRYDIGRYTYSADPKVYHLNSNKLSDKDDIVKGYDSRLHQSLDKIFSDRCSSNSSSSQIDKFRYDPQHSTDWKSIIKPILDQEPVLSEHFSKEELGKLSLLWISVLAGYEKSAELLVRSGADVNELFGRHDPQVIDEKWTVLHVMLQMGPLYSPEIERLISLVTDHGADFQARDCREKTVLHHAVDKGRLQMTEMLLEKGADINAADYQGMTPLHIAVANRKPNELVMLLMKHGADIFAKDCRRMNVLHLLGVLNMSAKASAELARVFIERGVSLDDKAVSFLNQPLHLAMNSEYDELAKLYLVHSEDVNVQNEKGESPLYLAARNGKNEVVEILLNRGANIDLRTTTGRTALHGACEYAASNPSHELLRLGTQTLQILTLMQIVDRHKHKIVGITAIIKQLLFAGADVLAEDSNGHTSLALILSRGNVEVPGTRLLIKALALKKVLQPSIELKDEGIIEQYPELHNYYRDCFAEIDKMKITRFIHNCTFFELFSKSYCQIAGLMRNPNFETTFKQCDLSGYPTYAEDMRRAIERAQNHYQPMLKQADEIVEALYNILPDLVVDKLVHYVLECCKNSIQFNLLPEKKVQSIS